MKVHDIPTFPVKLNLKLHPESPAFQRALYIKHVDFICKGWRKLMNGAPTTNCVNYAIRTGSVNGITVLDYTFDPSFPFELDRSYTPMIDTPSGGRHFYFQYEPGLQSIYHALPNLSVLNDNCCVFLGEGYRETNDLPIQKMPQTVLELLLMEQKFRAELVDQRMFDLFSLLPDEWFNESELVQKLICVLRNLTMPNDIRVATMRKLLSERSDNYHDSQLLEWFNSRMTYKKTLFGIARLKKYLHTYHPDKYCLWLVKYEPSKGLTMRLRYKLGALVKLSELKSAVGKNLTVASLTKINPQFRSVRKSICKSCRRLYVSGCCANYKRGNNSSAIFIENVEIIDLQSPLVDANFRTASLE